MAPPSYLGSGNKPRELWLKIEVMTTSDALSPSQAFLESFRRHGAGISVVTLRKKDGSPTGFIATSLASLSANPPIATFNMAQTASSWPSVSVDTPVIIHLLSTDNLEVARKMAGESDQRFDGDHWERDASGLPLLKGVHAWMSATVVAITEVEFSAMVAARITGGSLGDQATPLVYSERDYRGVSSL
jgi:flavin reductase (DIM6/NTAB) family NADH-FMN oxidoreductase RutF